MSIPAETAHKSPPRNSEWTGMKAIIASAVGVGLLPLAQAFRPEVTPLLALAALGAYAFGLIRLWKPLNSIHPNNGPAVKQD